MGGEHAPAEADQSEKAGSSPRGRGTPALKADAYASRRFIPAWAGNTRPSRRRCGGRSVHPRVGGEHELWPRAVADVGGSSPRGRGTRHWCKSQRLNARFIPAWAGNTNRGTSGLPRSPVHPRVGGEHGPSGRTTRAFRGSSPRGRGTLELVQGKTDKARFIPAWAGNTRTNFSCACQTAVHPRVGGEHAFSSSARARMSGSSPRGRGTRCGHAGDTPHQRFIPAWAGNTGVIRRGNPAPSVHPRVGGEHDTGMTAELPLTGSSPRGRGTLGLKQFRQTTLRFIPAWAGNTLCHRSRARNTPVHPRVGGEHSIPATKPCRQIGSSPRGRGTLTLPSGFKDHIRFIPAWAGNTCTTPSAQRTTPVHPRVGGEHTTSTTSFVIIGGSSPRGRGTRRQIAPDVVSLRFIPAWAGNTTRRSALT